MSKKDTYYFSHDYNSRSDEKIKKLFMKHGIKGYGIFWALIEDLYNNANALRTDYESIAFELREDISLIESVIKNFDLFVIDGDFFGSLSVERRLSKWKIKSEQASNAANSRWRKTKNTHENDADAQKNECGCIADAQKNDASGDAIRYDTIQYDSKENKKTSKDVTKKFVKPTIEEIRIVFIDKGFTESEADKFYWHHDARDWMLGKSKMKSVLSAINYWLSDKKPKEQSKPINDITFEDVESFVIDLIKENELINKNNFNKTACKVELNAYYNFVKSKNIDNWQNAVKSMFNKNVHKFIYS